MSLPTYPDNGQELSGVVILLVDDDPAILEGVADLLELHGFEVMTARDGRAALSAMQHKVPDLVISDIMMPDMDGYAFFEAVRSNSAWTAIPFIFLTARGQQIDVRRGQILGADAYLIKPFEPEDLLVTVEGRLKRVRDIHSAAQADIDRLKSQLITVFSHELRTPLTYVYGYINLLREQFDMLDRESIMEMLDGIYRGAERLVHLVEDLMLMVRIDSGVVEMEIALGQSMGRVGTIVEKVLGDFQPAAEARNVQIEVDVPDEVAACCASLYLEDALSRLVDNAIKFCRQDHGCVVIRGAEQDGQIMLSVQDNGIGITPAFRELIFERFEQLDRDVLEQQGIGLGLTLARRLVRLHGGDILVESEPGQGSTFTIVLPLNGVAAFVSDLNCGTA